MMKLVIAVFVGFLIPILPASVRSGDFKIDFESNQFLKDGQPFRYISGSIHYFRIPQFYWEDRLVKMKAAGLNAIEFYLPWNVHEPHPGLFNFEGEADVEAFLGLAHRLGFVVILRAGPYTCGEWENGGLPWWLLKTRDIRMRTSDTRFLSRVSAWYAELLPRLVPYLYKNGGPIILIQVENEYGSFYACDIVYGAFLRDLFRSYVGYDTVLVTDDGGALSYLKCGYIPNVYPTVDFGTWDRTGVAKAFQAQRTYAPRGPLVNTEFYPGWLDTWGQNFSLVQTEPILNTMEYMYSMNASFNFYMFEGGTNFGYTSGAGANYPVTTTYDYDAPLTEAGDPTPKFFRIREKIRNLTQWDIPSVVPPPTPKANYGKVPLEYLAPVTQLLNTLSPRSIRVTSPYPLTMEEIDFPYGFVLYRTKIPHFPTPSSKRTLDGAGVKDRGYVMVDGVFQGTLVHGIGHSSVHQLEIHAESCQTLDILVENNGRLCSGLNDFKGVVSNITLDKAILTGWTHFPIQLENVFNLLKAKRNYRLQSPENQPAPKRPYSPSLYYSKFQATEIKDTFFDPSGWGKGQLFLNGKNVGRYWPSLGPQVTLYVPKTMVKPLNYVLALELENPGNCKTADKSLCAVDFVDTPYLNKTVHFQH